LGSLLLVGALLCAWGGCQRAQPPRPPEEARPNTSPVRHKVLLVHSYHPGYPWTDAISRGVRMNLPSNVVDLQIVYMDTKRKTSEAWKSQAAQRMLGLIDTWKPDVVIAADDNAQQYVGTELRGRNDVQLVFCGVNAEPDVYGYPAANVTGVLERPHFAESLAMLQAILPDARRVAVLSDASPTTTQTYRYLKRQAVPLEVTGWHEASTFSEWKQVVQESAANADAIAVYTYHAVAPDEGGESLPPEEVMAWTTENASVPILGFLVFAVDDGAMCGQAESGTEHGLLAADLVAKILEGKTAAELPIIQAQASQSMLNLHSARRLGIDVPQEIIDRTDLVVGK
jgi:ABC-type uncharacterized transport system substrate-binding protein